MSLISGGLAKKHLQVPASLITDTSTINWMKESNIYEKSQEIFEQIITTDRPVTDNQRRLYDGSTNDVVPFVNSNRCSVWDLTPYDRTLLIDSDFLIFSNSLSEFWEVDQDVMIGSSINDIYDQKRLGYHDRYISDTGLKLYWATTVMFTKNQNSKFFFDTVTHVKDNYRFYADLYRFDNRQYRNDISFSVAKHIFDGFETTDQQMLPPVLTALDRDVLVDIQNNKLTFLVNYNLNNEYCAASLKNIDIHIMNKQSIHRNKDQLLGII
jgi:hypothetical protein